MAENIIFWEPDFRSASEANRRGFRGGPKMGLARLPLRRDRSSVEGGGRSRTSTAFAAAAAPQPLPSPPPSLSSPPGVQKTLVAAMYARTKVRKGPHGAFRAHMGSGRAHKVHEIIFETLAFPKQIILN